MYNRQDFLAWAPEPTHLVLVSQYKYELVYRRVASSIYLVVIVV
jgi:hypothetical protein